MKPVSTPLFQPVPSVMFVGIDGELVDDCVTALPHLSVLRVKHAAGAVERMVVTRPLVVVVGDAVPAPDLATVVECASDIRAEVLEASAAPREDLASRIRSAALVAERRRASTLPT
jgi:hypothetical protein